LSQIVELGRGKLAPSADYFFLLSEPLRLRSEEEMAMFLESFIRDAGSPR
jgi:hypothetical protein